MSDEVKPTDPKTLTYWQAAVEGGTDATWNAADVASLLATVAEREAQIAALTTERGVFERRAHAWEMNAETYQRENNGYKTRATSAEATCARLREALLKINQTCGQNETVYGAMIDEVINVSHDALTQADGERS